MRKYKWAKVTQEEMTRIFAMSDTVEEEYRPEYGHDGQGRLLIHVPGLLVGDMIGEIARESANELEGIQAIWMDFLFLAEPFDYRHGEAIVACERTKYVGPLPLNDEELAIVARTVNRECGRLMVVMADGIEGRETILHPWDSLLM